MKTKLLSEFTGTALLLAIVVGSGIMGETLAAGNTAIALLANSFATGFGLTVIILIFAPFSGSHFNPAVSLSLAVSKQMPWRDVLPFCVAQFLGAISGVTIAHVMFHGPYLLMESTKARQGGSQYFSEGVATFGLILTIKSVGKYYPHATPYAVGAYIASAYWFTASTSFANPAVTFARAFTPTFAGIQMSNVLPFCASQLIGAAIALLFFNLLDRERSGK